MKSCQAILRRGPGSTLTIVVGGAAESLAAHPGTANLTLRRRLGFIKLAMRNGADLVPVFSFGENEIFEQIANEKGTTLYTVQKKFQKVFGFTLPLFFGRGIFNYNMGLMPYRHPIVSRPNSRYSESPRVTDQLGLLGSCAGVGGGGPDQDRRQREPVAGRDGGRPARLHQGAPKDLGRSQGKVRQGQEGRAQDRSVSKKPDE